MNGIKEHKDWKDSNDRTKRSVKHQIPLVRIGIINSIRAAVLYIQQQ